MRLLVTRPEVDSTALAQTLEGQGHTPILSPLLEVAYTPKALPSLDGVSALVFTSANGVRAFTMASPRRDFTCYAVGDRTAVALRDAGFDNVESAAGDVDSLARLIVRQLQPPRGKLLHIAGTHVAGDLAGCLGEAGFSIQRAVFYETVAVKLGDDVIAAFRQGEIDGVLLFSPRTAKIFAESVRSAALVDLMRPVTAWCLSKAVADGMDDIPFARVAVPAVPTQDALLELLNAPATSIPTPQSSAQTTGPQTKEATVNSISPPTARSPITFRKPLIYSVVIVVAVLSGATTAPFWMPAFWLNRHGLLQPPPPLPTSETPAFSMPGPTPAPRPSAPIIVHESTPADNLRIEGLSQSVIALQRKLAEIATKPAPAPAQIGQVISDQKSLAVSLAALEARVTALENSLRAADNAAATTQSLLIATEELRQDLIGSSPYDAPLAVIKTLGGNDPRIIEQARRLSASAASGIPSRSVLAQELSDLIPVLAAPAPLPNNASWWQRLVYAAERLVVIRRVSDDPDDLSPSTVARRAATDLDRGDLAGAIETIETITGPKATLTAAWLDSARQRVAAENASDSLLVLLTTRLANPIPTDRAP